jgi:hypothetical protein
VNAKIVRIPSKIKLRKVSLSGRRANKVVNAQRASALRIIATASKGDNAALPNVSA